MLNSLQSASQRLDRIEAYTGLYLATKNEDQLIAARSNVVSLSTSSTRIRSLVFDNAVAVQEVTALGACATRLAHDLERVPETGKSPQTNILKCRQTLGRMSEQERTLLKQRTEASRERSQRSVVTEFSMGGISLLALVFLFGFLIRDAFRRKSVAILTNRTNSELATTVQQLHNRAEESRLLTDARDELQLCTGLDQVYRAAVSSFARLAPATSGTICMINNSRAMAEVVARWGPRRIHGGDLRPRFLLLPALRAAAVARDRRIRSELLTLSQRRSRNLLLPAAGSARRDARNALPYTE
ncbi:hypothetical protein [Terriglobus roseus]|uniref:hypothetical protein n=1 Tax=Terriglobus roseus TaxID=392734 RepID=UPI0002FBAFAE|nr:hypothetical protein [Terriglobus roseus]